MTPDFVTIHDDIGFVGVTDGQGREIAVSAFPASIWVQIELAKQGKWRQITMTERQTEVFEKTRNFNHLRIGMRKWSKKIK